MNSREDNRSTNDIFHSKPCNNLKLINVWRWMDNYKALLL